MNIHSPGRHNSLRQAIAGPCQDKPRTTECVSCILDTSDYFSNLDIASKRHLQTHLQLKNFTRRQTLYREKTTTGNLYILVSGEVKVYKSLSNGRQQIHKVAQIPGDLIACEDLYLDTHGSSAEAITDTTVCFINRNALQMCARTHKDISYNLMHFMSRNLNLYIRHIASLGQKTAIERVASYLLFLQQSHNSRNLDSEHLVDSLSRVELADMLGITQRTLIRSLRSLEQQQLITLKPNRFIIQDLDALRSCASG